MQKLSQSGHPGCRRIQVADKRIFQNGCAELILARKQFRIFGAKFWICKNETTRPTSRARIGRIRIVIERKNFPLSVPKTKPFKNLNKLLKTNVVPKSGVFLPVT
jgi:hypothetical protein